MIPSPLPTKLTNQTEILGKLNIVPWIIWAAICMSVVMYQFVLGHGLPLGRNAPGSSIPVVFYVCLVQFAAVSIIRWFVIARLKTTGAQLIALVAGLAMAESSTFFSIFLVPADLPEIKMTMWLLSLLGCLQFAPTYFKAQQSKRTA